MKPFSPRSFLAHFAIVIGLLGAILSPGYVQSAPRPTTDAARAKMPKVRIANDGTRFVLEGSDKAFVPWGFNYLGRDGKLIEETWADDWGQLEAAFRDMRQLGANVVRVHLQFSTYMKGPDKVDPVELGRLKNMLDLARQNGLYLDITGLGLYRLDRIPGWYDKMNESQRWDAQAVFWEAIARTCAGHPAVFCYDLMNEPVIGGAAKKGQPRWVGGELGGLWFVQRLTDDLHGRTSAEIAEAWVEKLTAAIRREDSQTPITVGVIPWALVWPNAKPLFYSPRVGRHLDFVSIHLYPGKGEIDKAIKAVAVYDVGKPLVIEETFPLSCSIPELNQFIDGSKERVDGWISHYFGHTIAEQKTGAQPGGAMMADFLTYWRDKGRSIVGTEPEK